MIKVIEELLTSGALDQANADKLSSEWADHTKKLNDEAKQLRLDNETMSKSYDAVVQSESEMKEQLKGLDDKITEAKKAGQTELQSQLEAERTKHIELQDNLSNLQKMNGKLKLDNVVSQELEKYDIKKEDRDLVKFRLRANVSLGDDDAIIYQDGNATSSLEDGFKGYFEVNKSRLNPVGDGNGSGASGGSGGGAKSMDRTAFEKLQPGQKADFMATGGTLTQ